MRIYVCISGGVGENRDNIRADLHTALQKYYGKFKSSDIKFFKILNSDISIVYVMEKAKGVYANADDVIKSEIEEIIKKYIPDGAIDVKLNYSAFMPDFKPDEHYKSQLDDKADVDAAKRGKMNNKNKNSLEEFDYEKLSLNYQAYEPHYSFEQMILPKELADKIDDAVATIQAEPKVFDEWGLRNIIPFASAAISFYGPPGTGKAMAAEAIAKKLGKKIIRATYADIESKFHGEGPKMVKAIFHAAEREKAVLFIDESDSLLSKRLTNVTDGSAQAINSMRSQLLICLEQFSGIVIFATNLVVNYDKAFLSRLISIEFKIPDVDARKAIWQKHVAGDGIKIPLDDDVNIDELAEKYEFCGRDIKKSVLDACVSAVRNKREKVCQEDFIRACEKTIETNKKLAEAEDHTDSKAKVRTTLTPSESKAIDNAIQKKVSEEKAKEKAQEKRQEKAREDVIL